MSQGTVSEVLPTGELWLDAVARQLGFGWLADRVPWDIT
jgi:hypothetical protein